jgi:hypothetical protein
MVKLDHILALAPPLFFTPLGSAWACVLRRRARSRTFPYRDPLPKETGAAPLCQMRPLSKIHKWHPQADYQRYHKSGTVIIGT